MSGVYDKKSVSEHTTPAPKRIVICCDGTWQSSVSLDPKNGVPSNVTRLCRVLAGAGTDRNGKVWQQVVYYDSGVGTNDSSIFGIGAMKEGGLGIGLLENVVEAYNFIVNNYSPGDELCFFGFSRGAYTARATAALLCEIGIIDPTYMSDFVRLYALYTEEDVDTRGSRFAENKAWREFIAGKRTPAYAVTKPEDVVIKVIGVWDTVGALGVPDMGHWWNWDMSSYRKKYEFINVDIDERVHHAYQALALDEQRKAFQPCLWKIKKIIEPDGTEKLPEYPKLVQCWFPGAHINIGGGSSSNPPQIDESDPDGNKTSTNPNEQLAIITYAWMLDRIRPHLAFNPDAFDFQLNEFATPPEKSKPEESDGWIAWGKRILTHTAKKVVPYSYAMGSISDSHTTLYTVMSSPQLRTPGMYHQKGEWTGEKIHPTVFYRKAQSSKEKDSKDSKVEKTYVPIAMPGWERVRDPNLKTKNKEPRPGWVWIKKKDPNVEGSKDLRLVEFEVANMPAERGAEKRLIEKSWKDVGELHTGVIDGWKKC